MFLLNNRIENNGITILKIKDAGAKTTNAVLVSSPPTKKRRRIKQIRDL